MAPIGGWSLHRLCGFFLLVIIVYSPLSFIIIILIQHFDGHTHYQWKKVIAQLSFFTITLVITAVKLTSFSVYTYAMCANA